MNVKFSELMSVITGAMSQGLEYQTARGLMLAELWRKLQIVSFYGVLSRSVVCHLFAE